MLKRCWFGTVRTRERVTPWGAARTARAGRASEARSAPAYKGRSAHETSPKGRAFMESACMLLRKRVTFFLLPGRGSGSGTHSRRDRVRTFRAVLTERSARDPSPCVELLYKLRSHLAPSASRIRRGRDATSSCLFTSRPIASPAGWRWPMPLLVLGPACRLYRMRCTCIVGPIEGPMHPAAARPRRRSRGGCSGTAYGTQPRRFRLHATADGARPSVIRRVDLTCV